jgi:DNA mismatch repair protein MutS
VIKRARTVLADLEATKHTGAALGALDALPLFSLPAKPETPELEADALRERLAELAPDEMSPRDALAALYELKRLI